MDESDRRRSAEKKRLAALGYTTYAPKAVPGGSTVSDALKGVEKSDTRYYNRGSLPLKMHRILDGGGK